jgi:hypothetical protein
MASVAVERLKLRFLTSTTGRIKKIKIPNELKGKKTADTDQNTWRLKLMGARKREALMTGLQKKVSFAIGA